MKLAAILLAAGQARRMGGPKLEARKDGRSVFEHTLCVLLTAPVEIVVAVIGTALDPSRVEGLSDPRVRAVVNPAPETGLSGSLKLGLGRIDPSCAGIFIVLADMPGVGLSTYLALADAFESLEGRRPIAPCFDGRRGHPVLLPAQWAVQTVDKLSGDQGFAALLAEADLALVGTGDAGVITDLDTPGDLAANGWTPAPAAGAAHSA